MAVIIKIVSIINKCIYLPLLVQLNFIQYLLAQAAWVKIFFVYFDEFDEVDDEDDKGGGFEVFFELSGFREDNVDLFLLLRFD